MQCDLDDQREIPYHLEKWRKQAKNRVTQTFFSSYIIKTLHCLAKIARHLLMTNDGFCPFGT